MLKLIYLASGNHNTCVCFIVECPETREKMIEKLILLVFVEFISKSVASQFNENPNIPEQLNDYCQVETFNPRCWKNEVIIMQSARFGRMQTGRCLEDSKLMEITGKDPQYLGCFADVLAILDRRCSGKMHCDVRFPDIELLNTKPCYPGLEMFLEAKYACISVVDNDRSCRIPVTSSPQHILGYSASSIGCGGKTQPWILEAPIGQRINISMIELHGNVWRNANPRCDQYGYILEKSHKENVSICSSVGRERNVHVSVANMVEIVFTVNQEIGKNDTRNFIMRFEAIGCSDLVPPEDAWLKRSTDEAIVGCYSSRQTWQLRCNGHQWIGVLGNCSHVSVFESLTTKTKKSDYQVLGLVAICGVGLAICLTIVCIGALCIKRFQKPDPTKYYSSTGKPVKRSVSDDAGVQHQSLPYPNTMKSQHPTYAVYGGSDGINCNGSYNRTDPTQYFVLDPEVIAREQLIQ